MNLDGEMDQLEVKPTKFIHYFNVPLSISLGYERSLSSNKYLTIEPYFIFNPRIDAKDSLFVFNKHFLTYGISIGYSFSYNREKV